MMGLSEKRTLKLIRREWELTIGEETPASLMVDDLKRIPPEAKITDLEMCESGVVIITFAVQATDEEASDK